MTRVWRSRWLGVSALVVAAVALLASSGDVQARPKRSSFYPTVAGETTITATGNKGITVRLPRDSQIKAAFQNNVELEVEGADVAYVVVASRDCLIPKGPPDEVACSIFGFWRIPESWSTERYYLVPWAGEKEGPIPKGLVNIYVMSEGKVTITIPFEGFDGRTRLEATGGIDGVLERLPVDCPSMLPDCDNVGYGGAAHRVGGPSLVSALAYSEIRRDIDDALGEGNLAGNQSNVPCVYPGPDEPNASPDPEDHPWGCDYTPDPEDPNSNRWVNDIRNYTCCTVNRAITTVENAFPSEPGKVYVGYTAHAFSASGELFGGDRYGAFGSWLTLGVDCPSGDFRLC